MDRINCDVLIVGAGPAGSSAARACAKKGLKTIFIDKRKEIGVPALCAEGIGSYLFSYLPKDIIIPKEQLIWKIDGIRFCCENYIIDKTGGFWDGYAVDRTKFDKWLSYLAIEKGARLFTDTELIELIQDKNKYVKKAIIKKQMALLEVYPKIVIGADGVDSKVSKLTGLYKGEKYNIIEVYSWEMENLTLENPNLEQIFFEEYVPGGYAYIFPKSKTRANIGVGGFLSKEKIKKCFNKFLDSPCVKKQIKGGGKIVEKSKKAVFSDVAKKNIFRNVILTGDAANHNLKPFVEGILPAIISGDLSGELASELSGGKNISYNYHLKEFKKLMHPHHSDSKYIEEYIIKLNKSNKKQKHLLAFGLCIGLFELEKIEEYEAMNYEELKEILIENGM